MKITVDVDELVLKGLNNAVIAYGNVCSALILGCEVPSKLEPLRKLSDEEMQMRFTAVKDLYMQLAAEYDK